MRATVRVLDKRRGGGGEREKGRKREQRRLELLLTDRRPLSAPQLDLNLAYSPGVAEPVRAIHKDKQAAYDYTRCAGAEGSAAERRRRTFAGFLLRLCPFAFRTVAEPRPPPPALPQQVEPCRRRLQRHRRPRPRRWCVWMRQGRRERPRRAIRQSSGRRRPIAAQSRVVLAAVCPPCAARLALTVECSVSGDNRRLLHFSVAFLEGEREKGAGNVARTQKTLLEGQQQQR